PRPAPAETLRADPTCVARKDRPMSALRTTAAVAALLALAGPAPAQYTWTNTDVSYEWNHGPNWTPNGIPNALTADVTFNNTGIASGGTVTITGSVQARSITFAQTSVF